MAQRARPLVRTVHDLDLLPDDGNRYELIYGVLYVSAAPRHRHQRMLTELLVRLAPYASNLGLEILAGPHGIRASETTQVEPDIVCLPRADGEQLQLNWSAIHNARLLVEILSPSSALLDRGTKRELFLREGVSEYWIVDPQRCEIDVWRRGAESAVTLRSGDTLRWLPLPHAPAFLLDIQTLAAAME